MLAFVYASKKKLCMTAISYYSIVIFFAGSSVNQPNLDNLCEELVMSVAPHWYDLGVQLHLHRDKLNIIQCDNGQNCKVCLRKLLEKWLDNSKDITWNAVADALDLISKKNLARKIRCKYLSGAHT